MKFKEAVVSRAFVKGNIKKRAQRKLCFPCQSVVLLISFATQAERPSLAGHSFTSTCQALLCRQASIIPFPSFG